MGSQKGPHIQFNPKEKRSVCEFCEANIQNEAKSILRSKPMHTITINNATFNTGHLHVSSLTCSEHGHCLNYKINLRLHLAMASAKSVY